MPVYAGTIPNGGQYQSRAGATIRYAILHHAATKNGNVMRDLFAGRTDRTVSPNIAVIDGRNLICVPLDQRAWTSASGIDAEAWTWEIQNGTTAPTWYSTNANEEAAAHSLADWSRRTRNPLRRSTGYGTPGVLEHKDLYTARFGWRSYPTSCAGGLRVDWIIARARQIAGLGGTLPALPAHTGGTASTDHGFGLTRDAQRALQRFLSGGYYAGPADGVFGPASVRGMQRWLVDHGHLPGSYTVDGVPGLYYGKALQRLAARFGYAGPIDGAPGPATSAALVRFATAAAPPAPKHHPETNDRTGQQDGRIVRSGADWDWWEPAGSLAIRVQKALAGKGRYAGALDGIFGPLTRKGVQRTLAHSGEFVGLIDGVPERGAAYGVQTYGRRFGDYVGPVDGQPREKSWAGFALGLERP